VSKQRMLRISFPLGGLDRRVSYRQEPPYTTPDCLNVWPVGQIEQRIRGGSRPGLAYAFDYALDSQSEIDDPIRLMNPMQIALSDGYYSLSDTFDGRSLSSKWSQSNGGEAIAEVLFQTGVSSQVWGVGTSDGVERHAIWDIPPLDFDSPYWTEIYIEPKDGVWCLEYGVETNMDDTTPDVGEDCIEVVLNTSGTPSIIVRRYYGGALQTFNWEPITWHDSSYGGWLRVYHDTSAGASGTYGDLHVYWQGEKCVYDDEGTEYQPLNDAVAGKRTGFGVVGPNAGGIKAWRMQGTRTDEVDDAVVRSMMVISSDGNIYTEETPGRFTLLLTDLSVRNDVTLQSVQSGQKLYIADYGDLRANGTDGVVSGSTLDSATYSDWTALGIDTDSDVCVISAVSGATTADTYKIDSVAAGAVTLSSAPGDGTCSFRIERAPKVYDPSDDSLSILTASNGQVPTGNPLMCRHLGRLFLGGSEIAPHVWYCSRQNDENDWDYAETDDQRAVAGTSSEVGVPGRPLTAMFSHSDDYLIFGCMDEIWRMRGDPAVSQGLDSLSKVIGIVSKDAWCITPDGDVVFLSANGVYILPAGGESRPIPLSRAKLPLELMNVDQNQFEVQMEYDVDNEGVHIFLTPSEDQGQLHWWVDWQTKTFWPVSFDGDHEPTKVVYMQSTSTEDSAVILGCRDGRLRKFSWDAENDTGTTFSSYIDIGPVPLASDGMSGILVSMDAVVAENSGNVTWSLYPGLTFEETATASVSDTGTWTEGLNTSVNAACQGQAFRLKITGTAGSRWALENVGMIVRDGGRRRKL